MLLFQIRWIFHLLVVSVLINDLPIIHAAHLEPSPDSKGHLFDQFVEESLAQVEDAKTGNFTNNLSENIDAVADYLNIGSDQSEALQEALAEAVNLPELLKEDTKYEYTTASTPAPPINSRYVPPSRRPGLLGLLDPDEAPLAGLVAP